MSTRNNYRIVMLLAVALAFGAVFLPYAGAQEWTLTGNVVNANTCKALPGATVSSAFNGNANNVTVSNGNYTLRLGFGSWNITISMANFTSFTFNTPYETTGSFHANTTYLLPVGGTAANCTKGNVTSTVKTTATTLSTVSSVTTMPQATQSSGSNSNMLLEVGIGVVVLIIIIAVAVMAMRGKKSSQKPQSAQKAEEKKS